MGREALAGVLGEEKGFRPQRVKCFEGWQLDRRLLAPFWHFQKGGGHLCCFGRPGRAAHRHRWAIAEPSLAIPPEPQEPGDPPPAVGTLGLRICLASGRVVN